MNGGLENVVNLRRYVPQHDYRSTRLFGVLQSCCSRLRERNEAPGLAFLIERWGRLERDHPSQPSYRSLLSDFVVTHLIILHQTEEQEGVGSWSRLPLSVSYVHTRSNLASKYFFKTRYLGVVGHPASAVQRECAGQTYPGDWRHRWTNFYYQPRERWPFSSLWAQQSRRLTTYGTSRLIVCAQM